MNKRGSGVKLKLKGWAIVKKIGGRMVFMPDPVGRHPIDGMFNYAFFGSEQSAENIITAMRRSARKYARGCKVIAVTLEMREVSKAYRIKAKSRRT